MSTEAEAAAALLMPSEGMSDVPAPEPVPALEPVLGVDENEPNGLAPKGEGRGRPLRPGEATGSRGEGVGSVAPALPALPLFESRGDMKGEAAGSEGSSDMSGSEWCVELGLEPAPAPELELDGAEVVWVGGGGGIRGGSIGREDRSGAPGSGGSGRRVVVPGAAAEAEAAPAAEGGMPPAAMAWW